MDYCFYSFQHHEAKAQLITEPKTFNNLLFRELISINAYSFAPGPSVNWHSANHKCRTEE